MKKDFNEYQGRVENLLAEGVSIRRISAIVGLSTTTLRKYLIENNISYLSNPFVDSRIVLQCVSDYNQGMTIEALSIKYKVGSRRIRTLLLKNGVSLRSQSDTNRVRFGYSINENLFKNTCCSYVQYLLGFLVTDGNITDDGRVSITVKSTDREILCKLQNVLGMNYGLRDSSVFDKRTKNTYFRSTLAFKCKTISHDLINLGLTPRKSMNETVPSCDVTRDFWRGVVDGDGCIYVSNSGKRSCSLTLVGSESLLQAFILFLESNIVFNTKRKIGVNKYNSLRNVQITGDDARRAITFLYKDSIISMERKQKSSEGVWNVK